VPVRFNIPHVLPDEHRHNQAEGVTRTDTSVPQAFTLVLELRSGVRTILPLPVDLVGGMSRPLQAVTRDNEKSTMPGVGGSFSWNPDDAGWSLQQKFKGCQYYKSRTRCCFILLHPWFMQALDTGRT